MGMDVFGEDPTAQEGKYFRRSVWVWHPLVDMCEKLAPDITWDYEEWHRNEGHGLDADGSRLLAETLDALLADGTVAQYINERNEQIAALPRVLCSRCDGIGATRLSGKEVVCKNCEGTKTQPAHESIYKLDEVDVVEWVAFLKTCGGFSIC